MHTYIKYMCLVVIIVTPSVRNTDTGIYAYIHLILYLSCCYLSNTIREEYQYWYIRIHMYIFYYMCLVVTIVTPSGSNTDIGIYTYVHLMLYVSCCYHSNTISEEYRYWYIYICTFNIVFVMLLP